MHFSQIQMSGTGSQITLVSMQTCLSTAPIPPSSRAFLQEQLTATNSQTSLQPTQFRRFSVLFEKSWRTSQPRQSKNLGGPQIHNNKNSEFLNSHSFFFFLTSVIFAPNCDFTLKYQQSNRLFRTIQGITRKTTLLGNFSFRK